MYGPQEKPLLVLDRRGEGRVALLLSDHAWLWARGFEGGGPHTALLRRLAHWLMKEPDLEEEVLTATARGSELVIERRSTSNEVGPVKVTGPRARPKRYNWRQPLRVSGARVFPLASRGSSGWPPASFRRSLMWER